MLARLFRRDSQKNPSPSIGTNGNNHEQTVPQATVSNHKIAILQSPSPHPQSDEQLGVGEDMCELVSLSKRSHISISIPRYRVSGSYIEYVIECTQGQKFWYVCRRYHQFKVLDQSLRQFCTRGTPNHGGYGVLPVLPVSHWMEVTNQSTQLVEKRRRYLEIYLQQLLVPGNLFLVARTPLYIFLHEGEVAVEFGMCAIQPLIGFSADAVEVESELCISTDSSDSHKKCCKAASEQVENLTCTHSHNFHHPLQLHPEESSSSTNVSPSVTRTKLPTPPPHMLSPPLSSVLISAPSIRSDQIKTGLKKLPSNSEFQEPGKSQSFLAENGIWSSSHSSLNRLHASRDQTETHPGRTLLSSSVPRVLSRTGTLATLDNINDTRSLKSPLVPLCLDAALSNIALASSSYDISAWGNEDTPSDSDAGSSISPSVHAISGQGAGFVSGDDKRFLPLTQKCGLCHQEFSSMLYPHRCFFCRSHFCFRCLWRIGFSLLKQLPPSSADARPKPNIPCDAEPNTLEIEGKKRHVNACTPCTENYKQQQLCHSHTANTVHAPPNLQAVADSLPMTGVHHKEDSKPHTGAEIITFRNEKGLPGQVELHDFQLITLLGHGSFGRVIKVRLLSTGEIYAMKVLTKSLVHQRSMDSYIKEERSILTMLPSHPYIVNCHFAFQTNYYIIFILDYLPGGELYDIMYHHYHLTQSAVQLYMAELVLAIEHIHSHDVVHRDIKSENILLDSEGHLRLNDFGLAHANFSQYTQRSFVGSAEYVAPEIVRCEKQTRSLDWWSLGVLFYEMLRGHTPFHAENNNEVYENILNKELDLSDERFFTPEAASLIQNLLTRDAKIRLQHAISIKAHPYFAEINWDAIFRREVPAPFVPQILDNNTRYFKRDFTAKWAAVPDLTNFSSSSIETLKECFDNFPYVKDSVKGCSSDLRSGFNTSIPISPFTNFQFPQMSQGPTTFGIDTPEELRRERFREQLVGMWRVVKVETQDLHGRIIYPWGGDLVGYLIYTPTQHFSMQLAPQSRRYLRHPHHPRDVPGNELCDVYCSYVAQFGRYELDETKPWHAMLCHHIEGSLCPNLAGHSVVMGLKFHASSSPDASGAHMSPRQECTLSSHLASVQMADAAKDRTAEEPKPSSVRLLLALSTMLHYVPGKPFKAQTTITWEKVNVA
ncbi:unnamed protein product [Phytomonas sp. Hart1]|nr:unnamed protein product [Phytomonas sp. Hart1]|eukprot:CCW68658.1 unnamed protein product [Phytomonas sp. isolate Hart1]